MMQAAGLLATNPKASDKDIDTSMAGEHCRCGRTSGPGGHQGGPRRGAHEPGHHVSRRGFLVGLAEPGPSYRARQTVPKLLVGERNPPTGSTHRDEAILHPNVFVGIDTDGRSTSSRIAPRWAPLPYLPAPRGADELDADWSA